MKVLIKKMYLRLLGKGEYLKKAVRCPSIWVGNTYGGFFLNPTLLSNSSVVYSFGIGEDISFDTEIINMFNCQVFGFDPTPKSINWVKSQHLPKTFTFLDYGIGAKSEQVKFFLPKNPDFVSGSAINQSNVLEEKSIKVQMKSFLDITDELGHNKIDVLKMDIEGSEYDVLNLILDSNICINQILVELHERFFNNGKEKTRLLVQKLKQKGFEIFAVSNSFEEISFVRTEAII